MMRCNAFARAIASLEAMHTSLVFRMLEDATLHSTRARIARRLMGLSLGDTTTARVSQSKIPISQDTLAKMLGITRQTLSLELKAMVTAGAIALGYGRIDILSAEILKSFEDKI
jgi:CRP-like cAMP-binding protein